MIAKVLVRSRAIADILLNWGRRDATKRAGPKVCLAALLFSIYG
ncbi:hypothetical protein CHELA40_11239 [Chelatococcus asaccharovorans]|nr:hypothetical protein CHELA40_11239 [Chelatococcus asaccharovorans]CAH1685163.1 hypothetical protein CHELA17_64362 [Chelatococcus asaccharovorans]